MDYKCKIISQSPGDESHLVNLQVEIFKGGGARFSPPKVFTVLVPSDADADVIRAAVRQAIGGSEESPPQVTISEMMGEMFDLGRGR